MEERKTDRELLAKGIRKLAIAVLCMFAGPTVIYQAFKNEGHPFYWPVIIMGLCIAVTAIVLSFSGLKTIMEAIFGKKK